MSDLINELRKAAEKTSDTYTSGLLFRAAASISDYKDWLDILKQEANNRLDVIETLKSLLHEISTLLRMLAGK